MTDDDEGPPPTPQESNPQESNTSVTPEAEGEPEPEELVLPAELLDRPGEALSWIMEACYGDRSRPVSEALGITRQTLWVWRNQGEGVPDSARNDLQRLIDDPAQPFRLAKNMTIEHLLRASAKEPSTPKRRSRDIETRQRLNLPLLDFLARIMRSDEEGLGLGLLEDIVRTHLPPGTTPDVLWQWAYRVGGIPTTYVGPVYEALTTRPHLWSALGLTEAKFKRYYLEGFVAEPGSPTVHALLAQLDREERAMTATRPRRRAKSSPRRSKQRTSQ